MRGVFAMLPLLLVGFTGGCSSTSQPMGYVDLGAKIIPDVTTVEHDFAVTNTTDRKIKMIGEDHSCACFSVQLERMSLKPGESTRLRLRVQLQPDTDDKQIVCRVHTDHPKFPLWPYTLRVSSYSPVRADPKHVYISKLNTVSRSDDAAPSPEPVAWVEAYDRRQSKDDAPELSLGKVPDGMDVRLGERSETTILEDGIRRVRYPIYISLSDNDPDLRPVNSDWISIVGPSGFRAGLGVTWKTAVAIEVNPRYLHFGGVKPTTEPIKRTIILSSRNNERFKILSIEGGSPLVTCTAPKADFDAERHIINVEFRPPGQDVERALSGVVRVETNLRDASECVIEWSALFDTQRGEKASDPALPAEGRSIR